MAENKIAFKDILTWISSWKGLDLTSLTERGETTSDRRKARTENGLQCVKQQEGMNGPSIDWSAKVNDRMKGR